MAAKGGKSGKAKRQAPTIDIREFRSKVAKLKEKGVVSKKVDARSQKATKYMRAKVRKFEDVIKGDAVAVRLKPDVRKAYADAGVFEKRGAVTVVPLEYAKQRVKIKQGKFIDPRTGDVQAGGLISLVRPLSNGQEERIILPYSVTDMASLANAIGNDPDKLDALKQGVGFESFAIKVFGWSGGTVYPDAQALLFALQTQYQHLFKKNNTVQAFKNFEIYRVYRSQRLAFSEGWTDRGAPKAKAERAKRMRGSNADRKSELARIRQVTRRKGLNEEQKTTERAKAKERMQNLRFNRLKNETDK